MDIRHEEVRKVSLPLSTGAGTSGELRICPERSLICNRKAAAAHVRSLPDRDRQTLLALYLDGEFKLLALEVLGQGNAAECDIKPMRIIRQGHLLGAAGFILVHYDPERRTGAGADERRVTKELKRVGEDFDQHLFDHLIVTDERLLEVAAW